MNWFMFFIGWLFHEDFVDEQKAQEHLDEERRRAYYQEQEVENDSHPNFGEDD